MRVSLEQKKDSMSSLELMWSVYVCFKSCARLDTMLIVLILFYYNQLFYRVYCRNPSLLEVERLFLLYERLVVRP